MPNVDSQQKLNWTEADEKAVNAIRILSADMVQKANSGHPGMPMGFALPAHVLWSRFLKFNPDNPFWPARDRFVLSCGHGSALLYSLMHFAGYNLPIEELKNFRQWGSLTPGHPEFGHTAGVETTTGPLGQGISNAVGLAMAQRYVSAQVGADGSFDPVNHFVYVIASDGDLQEGVSSEASSLAGRQKLGQMVVLYDDNNISIDGHVDLIWSEDVCKRYEAYGWHTDSVDGTDAEAIHNAILMAQLITDKPSLIRVKTTIGAGSPSKQDTSGVHGSPLGNEELVLTRKELNWENDPFDIPEEVYSVYTQAADRGRDAHEEWLKELEAWLPAGEGRQQMWDELMHGKMPENLFSEMPEFVAGEKVATRAAFGKVINAIGPKMMSMFGGNADLAGSTKATIKDAGDFLPESPKGRNINFGIREHAMGSIANGIALYGSLRPYTATFFVFSDYMRPTVRLAALMKLPVMFVFSHDSIGVGEDGPTHQPVEHYAAMRAIPNHHVFRPGDAAETAEAFKLAIERTDGPTSILTTRQGLPVVDRSVFASVEGVAKGAYVLADCEGTPEVILIATGSELSLAMDSRKALVAEGKKVRVVSMPCMDLFEEQDEAYRNEVLPADVRARVSVEAGISMGWHRWVGDAGEVVGLDHFGASAPAGELFKHFNITTEAVVEAAKKSMAKAAK